MEDVPFEVILWSHGHTPALTSTYKRGPNLISRDWIFGVPTAQKKNKIM